VNRVFVVEQLVRFSHCDPAGIVYYPAFFDLQHAVAEDWYREGVGCGLPELIGTRGIGTPTVSIQGEFVKPVRIGDVLRWELRVRKLGRASVQLHYTGLLDGIKHLEITQTIAFMDLATHKSVPIPEDLRPRIEAFLADDASAGSGGG
jgi:4-hydroxybenzoyl-CoA thioesterase